MTRREEIEHAGKSYCKDCVALKFPSCAGNLKRTDILAAYRTGAEWADKTMLDKVYDFIIANVYKYGKVKFVDNRATFDFRMNTFINDLKQVVEE